MRGGLILLIVWVPTLLVLFAMPLTFPAFDSAAFFSHALIEPRQPFSLTEIYFTSNPFDSLSRNVVPAVVLFSCLMGIGLIGLKNKDRLIEPLRTWNEAIVRITHFVIALTPYGVFAIGAVTAGTMQPETLLQLEVYFITFAVASLLLGFWVLPLMVTAVTPFSYREVAGMARDALLTAFVANSAFIVLPILVQRSKALLRKHGLLNNETGSAAEVMIPVMFNFPNAGKLMSILFIPFAAWFMGTPLELSQYPMLLSVGLLAFFGSALAAIPFLLDLMRLPADLLPLLLVAGIWCSRVGDVLGEKRVYGEHGGKPGFWNGVSLSTQRAIIKATKAETLAALGEEGFRRKLAYLDSGCGVEMTDVSLQRPYSAVSC